MGGHYTLDAAYLGGGWPIYFTQIQPLIIHWCRLYYWYNIGNIRPLLHYCDIQDKMFTNAVCEYIKHNKNIRGNSSFPFLSFPLFFFSFALSVFLFSCSLSVLLWSSFVLLFCVAILFKYIFTLIFLPSVALLYW